MALRILLIKGLQQGMQETPQRALKLFKDAQIKIRNASCTSSTLPEIIIPVLLCIKSQIILKPNGFNITSEHKLGLIFIPGMSNPEFNHHSKVKLIQYSPFCT